MLYQMGYSRMRALGLVGFAQCALLSGNVNAGVTLYEDGDTAVELGGRVQVQYFRVDPDTEAADSTDDLFLRRLRLDTEATLTEDWWGKWQIEFAGDEIDIKDAYLQYTGFPVGDITIGSHYVPFSREILTSSKYQQLVERTFVGDNNFGVPDRQVGVSLSGGERLQYAVGYYKAGIDPGTDTIDFDTTFDDSTEYSGDLIGGRLDFFPIGEPFDLKQGDFERTGPRLGIGANAYTWSNDDDDVADDGDIEGNENYDEVNGYGVDAQFKFIGLDIHAAYQIFSSETVDPVTNGLIVNGEGDFNTWAIEGGYMIPVGSDFVEPVFGYQVLDADAIAEKDERISLGINYFFSEHNDKLQFTYEMGSDVIATDNASDNDVNETALGDDQDRLFLQFQHLF